MKVTVEAGKCVAAGHCVVAAADVFDQDEDDGVVILLANEPMAEQHEAVRQAAQLCPASAIHISER